jgi:hypothetical protein
MKTAALLAALVTIAVGVAAIVATDSAMSLRRLYYATPGRFYAAGAVRAAMGLALFAAATRSRWPRIMRGLGALMCMQAVTASLLGIERARTVMEWEAAQGTGMLRAGAVAALASGVFMVIALIKGDQGKSESRNSAGSVQG